jgi:hypothetical protein
MPDTFADRVRLLLARSGPVAVGAQPVAGVPASKPAARLVFAVDATASRSAAWETAKGLTDTLIEALPGQLEVSLAVHGGGRVHTFTEFTAHARKLRKIAAGIRCEVGGTRLLDILGHVLECEGVRVVVYIGDTFEECPDDARRLADALGARGIRIIILHDVAGEYGGGHVFGDMARRTGGAVIPFDHSAVLRLRELLAAVAVLAVGGPSLLAERADTMAAAGPLLRQISSGSSSS